MAELKTWPAYVPHGVKTHATTEPPVNEGEPSPGEPRTRRALCGVMVYRGGPVLEWDYVPILDRCRSCARRAGGKA